MKKITIKKMIENSNIPASLIRGVIRQLGGWEDYTRQNLVDIANHGMDGGFHGFICYTDTVKFFRRHRQAIMELAEQQADEIYGKDKGALAMIAGFKCIMEGFTRDEIAKAIYTNKGEYVDQIQNCLAWYAGEEVARLYTDLLEQED